MYKFIPQISNRHFNTVNGDLVDMKRKDGILEHIEYSLKALSKLYENIDYVGCEKDIDTKSIYSDNVNSESTSRIVNIDRSFIEKVNFIFQLKLYKDGKNYNIKYPMSINIPVMINRYYYHLKGNEYYTPFQLLDTFTSKIDDNTISLRTIIKVLTFRRQEKSITDVLKNKYFGKIYTVSVIKKKVPFLLHYFAKFGMYNTIRFFLPDKDDSLAFMRNIDVKNLDGNYLYFKFGAFFMRVKKLLFLKDEIFRDFIVNLKDIIPSKMTFEESRDHNYFVILLGNNIADIHAFKKGLSLMRSLDNTLDVKTIENIKFYIKKDIENIYELLKWMFINFNYLLTRKNDTKSMRFRVGEYQVTPLIQKLNQNITRFLNSPEKVMSIDTLKKVFSISPNIIIDAIITTAVTNNNKSPIKITRYNNSTNDLSILSLLSATTNGPGSVSGIKQNRFGPSSIGKIDPFDTPASEPYEVFQLTVGLDINKNKDQALY